MIIDPANVFLNKFRPGRFEFPGKKRITSAPVLQSSLVNAGQLGRKLVR